MRTTIDIPDEIRQKLVYEAASRHIKGFSVIIVEALKNYFNFAKSKRESVIKSLKGSLSNKEYAKEMERLIEGRKNWRD